MSYQNEILEKLNKFRDKKYLEFSQSLIPNANANMLGVRIPYIRKIAKEISKKYNVEMFLSLYEPKFHEEYLLKAIFLNLQKDINLEISYAKKFIKTIPNWAVCDTFCIKKNKNLEIYYEFMNSFYDAKREFEIRFYYVFFMKNFLNLNSLNEIFKKITQEKSDFYYVKMAISWLLCESYIIDKIKTEDFIHNKLEDKFIKSKAISKIKDSFRAK
ncbi:DNA alkylation repair protein [Campylobacter sputorum]|uniref:DNA alkylation repair protein n=1 Tax=Campylobacter sputorum TaxID=206 RepID=UPI001E60A6D4|nr:DNA alkylation repair protein [Campylobacter sputorum]